MITINNVHPVLLLQIRCDVTWCDVMWCDVMWGNVMWRDVTWCDMIWCDVMWWYVCFVMFWNVMWCDVKRCDDVLSAFDVTVGTIPPQLSVLYRLYCRYWTACSLLSVLYRLYAIWNIVIHRAVERNSSPEPRGINNLYRSLSPNNRSAGLIRYSRSIIRCLEFNPTFPNFFCRFQWKFSACVCRPHPHPLPSPFVRRPCPSK